MLPKQAFFKSSNCLSKPLKYFDLPEKSIPLFKGSARLYSKSIGLTPNPARGILIASAIGKLCFEPLTTFTAAQNQLAPHVGRDALRSRLSGKMRESAKGRKGESAKAEKQKAERVKAEGTKAESNYHLSFLTSHS